MKCFDCENCVSVVDDEKNAKARCSIKNPPKLGKILTWAMTTYRTLEDAMYGKVYEFGDDRVKYELQNKKSVPIWCPIKDNT